MGVGLKSSLAITMGTMCIWATDALWRREETETIPQFLFWVFRLLVLADFFFPFYLCLAFLFLFSPLSSKPFWYFIREPNCLYSLSFSASLCHPPARSCSLPASFHLFLYLSQWELMWPLCAVSSLRGRQSSSAPIRTALSGAVSTTGLPTHSPIHACHPPPTGWEIEKRNGAKEREEKRNLSFLCFSIGLSFTHSVSLLRHPSLIVFTSRYLCFGP